MSELCTIGINHRTAPLALREMLAVSADGAVESLRQLVRQCRVPEAAILSTCNRTEVYCLSDAPAEVAAWLGAAARGQPLAEHIYQLHQAEAVRHLFRVASGLDSQMLGEPEITGQVKQFAQLARQSGFSGTVINRLMEHALATAKAVRTRTEIGRHSLSYPVLALRAAAGIFADLSQTAVLFVGLGDMTLAGVPIFAERGVQRIAIAGRNTAKTEHLAAKLGAEALSIARLPDILGEFDIVLTATASQVPIIGKGAVESALRARQRKPIMFADLAVPRDLEPEIQALPDVFVYHLDQFGAMADESSERRKAAARQGELIVEEHAQKFLSWLGERAGGVRVRGFRADAERISEEETRTALARLAAGVDAAQVVETLSRRLTGRLLHAPTQCARRSAQCALHEFSAMVHAPPADDSSHPEKTD